MMRMLLSHPPSASTSPPLFPVRRAVDFNEELSGLHGQTLLEQAEFLNDVIHYLLHEFYPQRVTIDGGSQRRPSTLPLPTSIILIGHSMGGFVSRALFTLPNYRNQSVQMVFTLATPHLRPAAALDHDLTMTYERVNEFFRSSFSASQNGHRIMENSLASKVLDKVSFVSIAGGTRDKMISSELCTLNSIMPKTNQLSVFTTSIPNVWLSADHQSILWCNQIVEVMTAALFQIVDPSHPSQLKSLPRRMELLQKLLYGTRDDRLQPHLWEQRSLANVAAPKEVLSGQITRLTANTKAELVPMGRAMQGKRRIVWWDRPNLSLKPMRPEEVSYPTLYMVPLSSNGLDPAAITLLTDMAISNSNMNLMLCRSAASKDSDLRCIHLEDTSIMLPLKGLGKMISYLHLRKEDVLGYCHFGVELLRAQSASPFLMMQTQFADDYKMEVEPSFFRMQRNTDALTDILRAPCSWRSHRTPNDNIHGGHHSSPFISEQPLDVSFIFGWVALRYV